VTDPAVTAPDARSSRYEYREAVCADCGAEMIFVGGLERGWHRKCPVCGTCLRRRDRSDKVYCSNRCRQRAHRERHAS